MPAERYNLKDRGIIKPGAAADVIVFDPDLIQDRATFDNGRARAEGVSHVFVNGQVALADGRLDNTSAGWMSRIANSFVLARSSWQVLKADKELILLPIISGIASIIVAATFIVPVFLVGGEEDEVSGSGWALMLLMYFVLAYITIFFNAALVSAANERLEGGDPTIGSAIRGAARRAGKIVPWALLSATVSIILRTIEERVGPIGRIIIAVVGAAWSVLTFLVLPIIVIEGAGAGSAFKKSGSLLRSTWGENLAAQVGMSLVGFLLILPGVAIILLGISAGETIMAAAVLIGVVWIIVAAASVAALSAIYQTALYHFAVAGSVPSGYFDTNAMQMAFRRKRR